jgi:predicted nucleic acid-binding protein
LIILDTNVLSALMRLPADASVSRWLDQQPWESVWTTAITVFEVTVGIGSLPRGSRRARLMEAFEELLSDDLENRILEFDFAAAVEAANLAVSRQARGRTVDFRDTQIAGIALARRASIATRNVRHFEDAGIPILNPWEGH